MHVYTDDSHWLQEAIDKGARFAADVGRHAKLRMLHDFMSHLGDSLGERATQDTLFDFTAESVDTKTWELLTNAVKAKADAIDTGTSYHILVAQAAAVDFTNHLIGCLLVNGNKLINQAINPLGSRSQ